MSGHVLEDLRILDQWAKQTVMSIKVSWQMLYAEILKVIFIGNE